MNVMIVDDEEMIRLGLQKILSKLDLPIRIVGSYGNGIDAWSRLEHAADDVDVLITDIKMPFLDGLQLVERVSARLPGVAIILLSGYSDFEYARTALRFGVRDYLLKPVDKRQLYGIMQKLHDERAASPSDSRTHTSSAGPESGSPITEENEHYVVEQIRGMLEKGYDQPFELEKLAQSVGMSGSYLSRLFKQKSNITMTDYVIQLRIEKAKELLVGNPSLRNYEISQLVGYHDPVYFNKLFKKMVGVTPKDYKEGRR